MSTETKRRITAEDLYDFELISEPRLSPDGRQVVFTKRRVQHGTEKKFSNLWMVNAAGGEPYPFTYGDEKDAHARFSPDGTTLAFLSDRDDKEKPPQIYLIPLAGGEAHRLTGIPGEIRSMEWSPDGKHLLLTVRKFDPDELERLRDEQKAKLGVVSRDYTRVFYKLDGYGYLAQEREHIWTVDVATGEATQLTDGPVYDETSPAYSPDGRWIVFTSNRSAEPDFTPDRVDLFVMPATGGEPRKLDTPLGPKGAVAPSVSPDGRWVAYTGHEGEAADWKNDDLWVVPFDGSGPARNLTEAFDVHVSSWTMADLGEPEQMPPTWSRDSQTLFFQVTRHGRTQLMSIRLDGGELRPVIDEPGVVGSFSFDAEQGKLAYFYADMADPNQIYLREAGGVPRPLTHFNRELLSAVDLGQVREVWYKGADGNDLQGWILTPPGFDPQKRYPAILEIHGGPLAQYGFFFMHEFYFLAAHDYVVFFTNPRGGRGYGWQHAKAIQGNWGDRDYADLMAWVDLVEKEPYVDAQHVGLCGGSYGGYMTLWMVGHTQRFQAAVAMRSVSNFISQWGSSDFNWSFENELDSKPPFESLQTYWDHSPMKYIGNCKTPTLVMHSEGDMRCSIEQSEQVFVALKRLGVETEFVRFPDEFHGLSRDGRTDRRVARLGHLLRWFETHLK
jgi:dipeptidyl aminopeptidase/acylaminoacyl peptidase